MNSMLDWDGIYKSGRDFGELPDAVVNFILSCMRPDAKKTFLDIGSGTGQLSRNLESKGLTGEGADLSAEAVSIASSKSTTIPYRQFDFEHDDITKFPGSYGLITTKHVYAFIQDKDKFLSNVHTLLGSDGIFALLTPLIGSVPKEKENIAVNEDDLRRDISKYFDIVSDRSLVSGHLFILTAK